MTPAGAKPPPGTDRVRATLGIAHWLRGPTYNHVSCTFECWRATGPHFSPNIGSPSVGKFNFARPLKCLPDYVHSEFSTLEIRIIIYCRRRLKRHRRRHREMTVGMTVTVTASGDGGHGFKLR